MLNFEYEFRIEARRLSRITTGVGDDPALSDPVIDLLMDVTMHPQRRLHFDDQVLQFAGVTDRQRIAPELGWN